MIWLGKRTLASLLAVSLMAALLSGCRWQDQRAYEAAKAANTEEAYLKYLTRFPSGEHRSEAQQAAEQLAWAAAGNGERNALQHYVEAYPDSSRHARASTQLAYLDWREADAAEAQAGATARKPSAEENAAWAKTDAMSADALKTFLTSCPDGQIAALARLALSFQEEMADVRSGKEQPSFVVPVSALGDEWKTWKNYAPGRGSVGFDVRQEPNSSLQQLSFWLPLPNGSDACVAMSGSAVPVVPQTDGSILALRTDGAKVNYVGHVYFQVDPKETLWFGVQQSLGLVYLAGKGKVFMPDGKETALPPPSQ